jgi:hypothetical protein
MVDDFLIRHGGRLRLMVVTGEDHDRAVDRCASEVAVLERVTAAVDARSLAKE